MNRAVFIEELKSLVVQRSFFLLMFGACLIHAFLFVGSGGLFDGHTTGFQPWINSSFEISKMGLEMNKIMLFLVPIWVGSRLLRDFDSGMDKVLYSLPVSKSRLYVSKFSAGVIATLAVIFIIRLVPILLHDLNGLDPNKMGTFHAGYYFNSFLFDTVPVITLASGLVFFSVAKSKTSYSGLVILVCLLLWQKLIQSSGLSVTLMSLLDPFFETGFFSTREIWTLEERNTVVISYTPIEIVSRVVWVSVGLGFLYLGKLVFNGNATYLGGLLQLTNGKSGNSGYLSRSFNVLKPILDRFHQIELGRWWVIASTHLGYALSRSIFWILTSMGLLFVIFVIYRITEGGDLKLRPAAHVILGVPSFFYSMIILLITFVFSGLFYHRSKQSGLDGIIQATGVRNYEITVGQLFAQFIIQIVLLAFFVVGAIGLQVYHGYWGNNWIYYIVHVGIFMLPGLLIWAIISQFVHHLVDNFYLGIVCLLLFWLGLNGLGQFGMDSRIWHFNYDSPVSFSQLGGYGGVLKSHILMKLYWLSISLIFFVLMSVSWRRGYRTLIQAIRKNYLGNRGYYILSLGSLLPLCVMLGAFISKEESKTFEYQFKDSKNLVEKARLKMEDCSSDAIPQIIDVRLEMDIFPPEKRYFCKGRYLVVNRSKYPIDSFVVRTGFEEETMWEMDNTKVLSHDSVLNWFAVGLEAPLQKGDTVEFEFQIQNMENTVFQRNSPVVSNGTYIKSDILPRFGPYNLIKGDEAVHQGHYQGLDSDVIDFSCKISTSSDQVPLTVGNLIHTAHHQDRNISEFQTDHPVKFGFSFHSGAFEQSNVTWQGKQIRVYHISEHREGVKSMMEGIKSALEYNTKYFSDYPHDQISIVPFPKTEGSYATAFGNLLPTSELRFLLKPDTTGIDLGFYVPAHEITHNWWGNELIPANSPGAHFLTESLTEYCTFQIYEDRFGTKRALSFMKAQHKRYFTGLSRLKEKEVPLIEVGDSDSFLSYGKGAIALRYLSHLWGEDNVNLFLKRFMIESNSGVNKYAYAKDWYCELQSSVPDSISEVAKELFESVCLRSVRADLDQSNGGFQLNINYEPICTLGSASSDWLEIGWFQGNRRIRTQRVYCEPGVNQFELDRIEGSDRLVIDPDYYWLDRDRNDNEVSF